MRHTQCPFRPSGTKDTCTQQVFDQGDQPEKKVLVVGDLHGNYDFLNAILNKLARRNAPELVLQVGDFGFFPNEIVGDEQHGTRCHRPFDPRGRVKIPEGTKVRWIDGNHEDHHAIRRLVKKHGHHSPIEVAERCYYMPRGSWMTLKDGRTVLFLGGAFSVDHALRQDHCGKMELLEEEVLARIPDELRVDIVISHTAPTEMLHQVHSQMPPMPDYWDNNPDPSCEVLQQILVKYCPALWYFGHFHASMQGEAHGCRWIALRDVGTYLADSFLWLDQAPGGYVF